MTSAGLRSITRASGSAANSMMPTVMITAAIMIGTSSVMPTAVRIESIENTMSSAMICAIARRRRSRPALVAVEQSSDGIAGSIAVMDLLGRLPQQEQAAREKDQVAPEKRRLERRLAVRPGVAAHPEIEQRRAQGHQPADEHQQAMRMSSAATARFGAPLLLLRRQLVRKNRDEDEVVDAEHDLEQHERQQGRPAAGSVSSERIPFADFFADSPESGKS
jgi:hypothetical protein